MPKVYNRHHKNAPQDAVYIGRGSVWGNPFPMNTPADRDAVCDAYIAMVEANPEFKLRIVRELVGKDLVCFCAPKRCHGDYLLKLANGD